MTDLIVTLMITILTLSLIPTVVNQFQRKASTMPLTTTIPSMIALTGLLYAYMSQGWWFSVGITVINYILWIILTFQRRRYDTEDTLTIEAEKVWDELQREKDTVFPKWERPPFDRKNYENEWPIKEQNSQKSAYRCIRCGSRDEMHPCLPVAKP